MERVWCRVRRLCADGALVARVENDLTLSYHCCGDEIVLRACHVLETATVADMLAYRRMAVAMGPMGGALAWQELRTEAGVAVVARPNTRAIVQYE